FRLSVTSSHLRYPPSLLDALPICLNDLHAMQGLIHHFFGNFPPPDIPIPMLFKGQLQPPFIAHELAELILCKVGGNTKVTIVARQNPCSLPQRFEEVD